MSQGGATGGNAYTGAANALTSAGGAAQNAINMYGNVPTAASGMATYQNPYTSDVINNSIADIGRANLTQLEQNKASAAASGAFGGSRHGLVDAATNEASQRLVGDMSANLRNTGFMNSANLANQDIANRLNGASGMLSGAGVLGNLGSSGFNMANTIGNQQWQQGLTQQLMEQQKLSDAMGMFSGYTGSPTNYLSMINSVLGNSPLKNNNSQTTQTTPGVFNYLSALSGFAAL